METKNMKLVLPEIEVTLSPEWGQRINDALEQIDRHTHTHNSGVPITPSGIEIDENLNINSQGFDNVNYSVSLSKFEDESINNSVHIIDGELYFKDGNGNNVQITSGGTLNAGAAGTVGGMTGESSVSYVGGSNSYFFVDEIGESANIVADHIKVDSINSEGVISGEFVVGSGSSGFGVLPIGGITALTSLSFFAVTNTTEADDNGYVLCQGQTINDPTSPMNGVVMPNLSDNRFLRGNSTSGSVSGSEVFTLTASNIPSHRHTMNHTHNMNHTHKQFSVNTSDLDRISEDGYDTVASNTYPQTTSSVAYTIKGTSTGASVGRTSGTSTSNTGGASTSDTAYEGSGTEVEHIPQYLDVVYVMRIK